MQEKITADMLAGQSDVVVVLFRSLFPEGLSLEEAKKQAEKRGWLRRVLESMEDQ